MVLTVILTCFGHYNRSFLLTYFCHHTATNNVTGDIRVTATLRVHPVYLLNTELFQVNSNPEATFTLT